MWDWANWYLKWDCEQGIDVGWKYVMVSEGLINAAYMWVGMQYVVEMYLWPILGVEVRRCVNFCDEKIYLSWPGANRVEVGEMGHPA